MARKTFCNRLSFEIIIAKKSSGIEENNDRFDRRSYNCEDGQIMHVGGIEAGLYQNR